MQVGWAVGTQNLHDECGRKRRSVRRTFVDRWERRDAKSGRQRLTARGAFSWGGERGHGLAGGISCRRAEFPQTWYEF